MPDASTPDDTGVNEADNANPVVPPVSTDTPDSSAPEPVKLSKNARKKAARENALPRDRFSIGDNAKAPGGKPGTAKSTSSINIEKCLELATMYEETINRLVDKFLSVQGAQHVKPVGSGAVAIVAMDHRAFGEVFFYVYKGKELSGSIGKALAFHSIVLSDGAVGKLEAFIERHRGGVSFIGIVALVGYIQFVVQQNAAIIEKIERDSREAQAREEKSKAPIDVEAVEVSSAES